MIIFRYFTKEVFLTLLAVTLMLILIFICNQFVRYLEMAAEGKLASAVVMQIMAMEFPLLLGLLLPLGLYLGILIGYGRLYVDSEMTVLTACGLSRLQILMMSMGMATIIAIIVAVFMWFVNPQIMVLKDKLLAGADSSVLMQTVIPQRFNSINNVVYYVKEISRDRKDASGVFITQEADGDKPTSVLVAKHAYQMIDKNTHDRFLVAVDGYRYTVTPGSGKSQEVKFNKYGIRIDTGGPVNIDNEVDAKSTLQLMHLYSKSNDAAAELQWRLSLPLSVFLLTFVAVPLSRVNPRMGRYIQLLPAALLYVVYANMMFVARTWVEKGEIPTWLGLWWLHLILLIVGCGIWWQQSGWRLPFKLGARA